MIAKSPHQNTWHHDRRTVLYGSNCVAACAVYNVMVIIHDVYCFSCYCCTFVDAISVPDYPYPKWGSVNFATSRVLWRNFTILSWSQTWRSHVNTRHSEPRSGTRTPLRGRCVSINRSFLYSAGSWKPSTIMLDQWWSMIPIRSPESSIFISLF